MEKQCKNYHKKCECLVCKKMICTCCEKYATTLKLDKNWDRKEPFDFNKHCTDEVVGYKHLKCI